MTYWMWLLLGVGASAVFYVALAYFLSNIVPDTKVGPSERME